MFLLGQLFTSGSRLFIAAIAVSVILYGSIQFHFLLCSIVILGVISTIYTMAGGIKGLIYIDTIQILLVIGTGLVALGMIYVSMTPDFSFGDIWHSLTGGRVKIGGEWTPGSKLQVVDASFRFDVPYNLLGALIGATVFKVVQFSTDHEFVQRQLTCKNVKTAGVSLTRPQLKANGVCNGVADLILLVPRHGFGCLCIELKTPIGVQRPSQKAWMKAVMAVGQKYVVCRTVDDFIREINTYLR